MLAHEAQGGGHPEGTSPEAFGACGPDARATLSQRGVLLGAAGRVEKAVRWANQNVADVGGGGPQAGTPGFFGRRRSGNRAKSMAMGGYGS